MPSTVRVNKPGSGGAEPFFHGQRATSSSTNAARKPTLVSRARARSRLKRNRETKTKEVAGAADGASDVMTGDGGQVKPLSQEPLDPSDELHDIEEFIERSSGFRKQEKEEAGKIKRPLNPFMLYRKMYQGVAKRLCKDNNHRTISAYCGRSWFQESPATRHKFAEWAETEKKNHRVAFPEYKFQVNSRDQRHPKEATDGDLHWAAADSTEDANPCPDQAPARAFVEQLGPSSGPSPTETGQWYPLGVPPLPSFIGPMGGTGHPSSAFIPDYGHGFCYVYCPTWYDPTLVDNTAVQSAPQDRPRNPQHAPQPVQRHELREDAGEARSI